MRTHTNMFGHQWYRVATDELKCKWTLHWAQKLPEQGTQDKQGTQDPVGA